MRKVGKTFPIQQHDDDNGDCYGFMGRIYGD